MFGSGVMPIDSNEEAGPDTLTENADPYCGPAPDVANLFRAWNLDPVLMAAIAMKREQQTSAFHRAMVILLLIAAFVSPLCALTTALFSVRIVHHILLVAVIVLLLWWSIAWQRRRLARKDVLSTIFHVAALAALASSAFVFPGVFWLKLC